MSRCSANFEYKQKPQFHPLHFALAFGRYIMSVTLTVCLSALFFGSSFLVFIVLVYIDGVSL
jgi:hypothetical protein